MSPNLFAYTDYRRFLKEWFEARAGRPSIRGFAKKIACSPAQLSSVIAGTRDLAGPLAEATAAALGLDEAGCAYFLDLVQFEQGETRTQRREALERVMTARRFHQAHRLEDAQYLVFSQWYYPALVELARCVGTGTNPAALGALLTPSVPAEQVAEALTVLRTHGRLVPGEPNWSTTHDANGIIGAALVGLHRWILERAQGALEDVPKDERYFGTLSLSIPSAALPELRRFVAQFEAEAMGRFTEGLPP